MPIDITVSGIASCPDQLSAVQALWRKNSKTLGMFPKGAFDEAANKDNILVATAGEGKDFAGYLLYRLTKRNVAITHLCVADSYRGKGVAQSLFASLATITRRNSGIMVRCRKDFDARSLWQRLGFTLQGTKPGRGEDGGVLELWQYRQDGGDLFTLAAEEAAENSIAIVIDANVLYDFDRNSRRADSSKALLADWLSDTVALFVTEEIYNEIDRCPDPDQKAISLKRATEFTSLECTGSDFDHWHRVLRPLFPDELSDRDRSDIRQLARAAGGGADFFATWDQPIVDRASDIEQLLNMRIVSPTDLISHIDELERAHVYQPGRYLGSAISVRAVRSSDIDTIANATLRNGESIRQLRTRLQQLVSSPADHSSSILLVDDQFRAVQITSLREAPVRLISADFVRAARGPADPTFAHQIVRQLVRSSASKRVDLVRVQDEYLAPSIEQALADNGFIQILNSWIKINLYGVLSRREAAAQLVDIANRAGLEEEGFDEWAAQLVALDPDDVYDCVFHEEMLWPLKISDANVSTYIVPIQPRWARELFDHRLTQLFSRRDDLAMNTEAVYYRSSRGPGVEMPARILWYVSTRDFPSESLRIRACSYLDEVAVGSAKDLYRRFRRLGIYEWPQVRETAKNDPHGPLMALRFSRTELLPNCIRFDRLQELLGRRNQIQGPVKLTADEFAAIYTEAITTSNS